MPLKWDDERYVRLYTRDTSTWLRLTWEGRFVLMALLRKLDRSGNLDLGDEGRVIAVRQHSRDLVLQIEALAEDEGGH